MLIQTPRQAHEVIAARYLDPNVLLATDISFDFRNGGVINLDTPKELKTALKVFSATYCHECFSGRLTFHHKPYATGYVKMIVAPKVGKKFFLDMDVVFPHVYDRAGDRIYDLKRKRLQVGNCWGVCNREEDREK